MSIQDPERKELNQSDSDSEGRHRRVSGPCVLIRHLRIMVEPPYKYKKRCLDQMNAAFWVPFGILVNIQLLFIAGWGAILPE